MTTQLYTIINESNVADAVSRIQKSFEYCGATVELGHTHKLVHITVHKNPDRSFMNDAETKRGARLYDYSTKDSKIGEQRPFWIVREGTGGHLLRAYATAVSDYREKPANKPVLATTNKPVTRILKRGEKKPIPVVSNQEEKEPEVPVKVGRSYKQVVVTSVSPQHIEVQETQIAEEEEKKIPVVTATTTPLLVATLSDEEQDDIDAMMDEVDKHLVFIDGRYVKELETHNQELQRQIQELQHIVKQQYDCYNALAQQWNDKLAREAATV